MKRFLRRISATAAPAARGAGDHEGATTPSAGRAARMCDVRDKGPETPSAHLRQERSPAMNGASHESARAGPPKATPHVVDRGFQAWDLILSGVADDAIAEALRLDPDASLQFCATVKRVTDVAGFLAASGADQAPGARGATTPAAAPFKGLLSFWNRELICRYANPRHEDWFKKPLDAILGHEMADLLGPVWFALCEPRIRLGVLTGQTQDFALITATDDGGMAHYLNYYVPSRGANGRIIGFFCYIVELADATV
jgi:hypothetical protein